MLGSLFKTLDFCKIMVSIYFDVENLYIKMHNPDEDYRWAIRNTRRNGRKRRIIGSRAMVVRPPWFPAINPHLNSRVTKAARVERVVCHRISGMVGGVLPVLTTKFPEQFYGESLTKEDWPSHPTALMKKAISLDREWWEWRSKTKSITHRWMWAGRTSYPDSYPAFLFLSQKPFTSDNIIFTWQIQP